MRHLDQLRAAGRMYWDAGGWFGAGTRQRHWRCRVRDLGEWGGTALADRVHRDRRPHGVSMMHSDVHWWSEIDENILACLDTGRTMTPGEIAQKLGVSESAAGSFLAMLALHDKVRILTVAGVPPAFHSQD